MTTSRRRFFSLFAGGAAGIAAGAAIQAQPKDPALQGFEDIQAALDALKKQMEQPIHITMVIDGKQVAKSTLPHLSAELKRQGARA